LSFENERADSRFLEVLHFFLLFQRVVVERSGRKRFDAREDFLEMRPHGFVIENLLYFRFLASDFVTRRISGCARLGTVSGFHATRTHEQRFFDAPRCGANSMLAHVRGTWLFFCDTKKYNIVADRYI
jgi:hypothetical protein